MLEFLQNYWYILVAAVVVIVAVVALIIITRTPKDKSTNQAENVEQDTKETETKAEEKVVEAETQEKSTKETKKVENAEKDDSTAEETEEAEEQEAEEEAEPTTETTKQETTKKASTIYHVIYDKDLKEWAIRKNSSKRASKKAKTKEEAIAIATQLCENNDAKLVVHKRDGKFQKKANVKIKKS